MNTDIELALHALYTIKAKRLCDFVKAADSNTAEYEKGHIDLAEYKWRQGNFVAAVTADDNLFLDINYAIRKACGNIR
jgi:hypothetical protein